MEAGFFPYPGMSKDASGKLSLAAITTPELALKWFWNAVLVDKESEVILVSTDKENLDKELNWTTF